MKGSDKVPPIVVIRKKGGHEGHHGGAWKVAYADFVTAMMALFIVLWIMSQGQAVREAVASYFKDPGAFSSTSKGGILPGEPLLFPKSEPVVPSEENDDFGRLKKESERIGQLIASFPEFERLRDKIEINVDRDGMRIELIENKEGIFFDIGSAKVKKETENLLKLIARELGKLENKIVIEGHTDARPYVTPGYSNWELSVDRANAARKILEENGLKKDQILMVKGLADRMLKNPERPYDFSNRRVTIVVTTSRYEKKLRSEGERKN